jgi:hypothetical protein
MILLTEAITITINSLQNNLFFIFFANESVLISLG